MNKYLGKALEVAKTSKCRYKHGCIVVSKRGKIIAVATNKKVADPSTHWRKSHIHAEFAALVAAGNEAHGSIIYVARVNAHGNPASSRPCKKCQGLIERFGVAKVVFT
jgi:pyrimidine deaminase RibD-like protein